MTTKVNTLPVDEKFDKNVLNQLFFVFALFAKSWCNGTVVADIDKWINTLRLFARIKSLKKKLWMFLEFLGAEYLLTSNLNGGYYLVDRVCCSTQKVSLLLFWFYEP